MFLNCQKKLVLFDLNGVLTAETEKYDSSKGGSRPELRLRPQVEHLLSLLPYYSLGVYSSSTLKTVMRVLGAFQYHLTSCAKKIRAEGHLTIPPGGVESVFQVILHRDHCIPDDGWQLRPGGQAFDTLKPLSYHGLDLTSTILVDNHAHKVFPGEERNMLVLKEWEHEADGGVLCWHMLLNQLKACAEAKDLRPLVPAVQSSITTAMGAVKHALAAAEDAAEGWPVDLTWYQASAAAVELSHLLAAAGSIKDPLPSDCSSSGTCPGSNLLPCTAGIAPDQIKDAVKASVRLAIAKRAQVDDDSTALAHHGATKEQQRDASDYRSTAIRNTPHQQQQQSEAGGSARPRSKATAAAAAATADIYPELPVPQGYPSSAQALYEDMYVSACLVPQSTATAASAEEDVLMMRPAADRDHDHCEVEDFVSVPVDESLPNDNAGQEPLYCHEDLACKNIKKSASSVLRGLSLLHSEVKRLALELLPTDEELEGSCLQPLQMVERAVRTLSPEARVVVVGSKSCGLGLPDSDLNICIQGTVGTFQSSSPHSASSGPKNTAASSPDNSNRVLVSQYLKRLQQVLHSMWYCSSMSVVQHPLANVSCAHKQTSFLRGMLHQTIATAGGTTTAATTAAAAAAATATATCDVQKQWRAPPVWVTISVSLQQAGAHTAVAVAVANRKAAAENPVYHALVPTVKALLREQGLLKVGREPGLSGHAVSLMVWAHLMCEGVVHTPPVMSGSIDDDEEVRRQSSLTPVHVVHTEHGEGMIKMQPAESVQGPPGRASSAAAEAVVPPEGDSAGGEVIEAVLVHEKTAATAGPSGGSGDDVEISGDASADKEKLQGCHEADAVVTEMVDEERNGVIVKPLLRHDEEMVDEERNGVIVKPLLRHDEEIVPLVECGVELSGHPAVKHHQSDPAGAEEAVPITVAELDVVPITVEEVVLPAGAEQVVPTAGKAVAVWAEPAGSEGVVTVAAKMAIAKGSELAVTVGAEDVEVLREGEVIKSHVACMRQALEGRSCTVAGQWAKVDEWDLGVLLLSFMRRYGQLFRYQHDAVSLRLGGIVPRTSWAKPFHKKRYIGRIFIEDPEESGACVESCKVSLQKLRALFVKALEILTKAASNSAAATDVSLPGPSSLLRHPSDNPNGHAVLQGGLRNEAGSSAEDGSCTASHIISPSFILLDSILHTNHLLATAHGRGSNHVVHLKQQGGSATSGTATAVQQMPLLPLGSNWQPRSIASAAVITALLQPRLQLCTAVTASTMPAESAAAAAGVVSVSLSQENGGMVADKNNDVGESNGTCITLQRCQEEDGGLEHPVEQGRPSNATTLRFQDLVVFLSHNKTQQGTQGSHLAVESQEHCSELLATEDGPSRLLSKGDLIHARSGQDDTSAMSAMRVLRMYQVRHGCKVITEESFRHSSDVLQPATFCCHIRLLIGGSSTDPHQQHQKVLAEGHNQSAESWKAAKEEATIRLIEELLSNGRVTLEDFLPPAAITAEGAPSYRAPSDPHQPPVVATLTPTSVVHLGGGDLQQSELQASASRTPASPASHEHCTEAKEDTYEASTKAPLGATAGIGTFTAEKQSTAEKDISTVGVKDPASGCPQELDHDVHCDDSSKALDKPLSRGRQEGGQDGAAKHKKRRIDNNSARDTRSTPAGPAVHLALDAYPKCKELISWLRSSLPACMEGLTGGDSPALPSLTPKVLLQEWVQRKRNCQVDFLETRAVLKWPATSSSSATTAAAPAPSTTAVAAAAVGVAVSGVELPNVVSSLPSLPRFEGTVVVRSTVTDQVLYGPMTGRANSRKGWQQDAAACLLEDLMVRLAMPFSDFSRKRAQGQRTSRTERGALEGGSALRSLPSTHAVSVAPAASTAELGAAGVVENHVPTVEAVEAVAATAVSGALGREGGERDAPKHANKQKGLAPPSAHQQAASAGKRRRLAGPGPSTKVGKPLARPGESISHRDLYRQTRLAPTIVHDSTRATAAGGVDPSTSRHLTLHDQQPSHKQQGPPSGGSDYPPPPPFPAHVQASRMLPLRTPDSNQKHKNGPLGTAVQRGSKKRRQGRQPQAMLQHPPGRNAFRVEKYHQTAAAAAAAAARVQGKSGAMEAGLERPHQRQQQPVASTLGQPGSAAVEYHSSAVNSWSLGMPLPAPAGSHNMEKLPGEQINTNMTTYSNLQHNHIPPQTAPATTSFHYSQQQHLAYPAALYLEQQQQYHNATATTSVTNNAHYSLLPQDAMAYPQHSLVALNSAQAAPPSYTLSAPSPNMNSSSGYQRKYGEAEIACLQNAAATNTSGASPWSGVVTNSYTPMQLPSGYNYQMTGHLMGPPQVSGYHQHSALNPQPTFHNQSNVAAATQQSMAPPAAWMWHRQ